MTSSHTRHKISLSIALSELFLIFFPSLLVSNGQYNLQLKKKLGLSLCPYPDFVHKLSNLFLKALIDGALITEGVITNCLNQDQIYLAIRSKFFTN